MDIISCLEMTVFGNGHNCKWKYCTLAITVFGNGHNCKWKYCTLAITLIGNEWPFSATVQITVSTVDDEDERSYDDNVQAILQECEKTHPSIKVLNML